VAKWRMKQMPLAEWGPLQGAFAELQMLHAGDPDLAMFMKNTEPGGPSEIYLTGPGADSLERLSPGGWQDSEAPSGKGVSILVSEGDPWEHFGIKYEGP
jgi:hypothetical protein